MLVAVNILTFDCGVDVPFEQPVPNRTLTVYVQVVERSVRWIVHKVKL